MVSGSPDGGSPDASDRESSISECVARCLEGIRKSRICLDAADDALLEGIQKQLFLAGHRLAIIDGADLVGKNGLMGAFAHGFGFPSHFGANWDALLDCLSDMSWDTAPGFACVLLNADRFRDAHPDEFETLCEVFEDLEERHAGSDNARPFTLITIG